MAKEEQKRPQARYAPGELKKIRENLGNITPEEAKALTKKLGGEIGIEKSDSAHGGMIQRGSIMPVKKKDTQQPKDAAPGLSASDSKPGPVSSVSSLYSLPKIDQAERIKMDILMLSRNYRIKLNFGFLNRFILRAKKQSDIVLMSFVRVTLADIITNMESLAKDCLELQKKMPESYKKKILEAKDIKQKIIKFISDWKFEFIREKHEALKNSAIPVTTTMLVPLIRELYKMLMPFYFLGEQRGADTIRNLLIDLAAYPDIDKNTIPNLIRKIAKGWIFLFQNAIPRMYPLLMRMCSYQFYEYPEFFTREIAHILNFLGITKYNLILPQKHAETVNKDNQQSSPESQEPSLDMMEASQADETTEAEQKKQQQHTKLVDTGLKLLDQLFPEAGWLHLSSHPDFYPYFQSIFGCSDGFALLAPENPVQKIIVLLYILEDLFRGCRSIRFDENIDAELKIQMPGEDSFTSTLEEWRVYKDTLFDKYYSPDLRDLVERLYSRIEFIHSPLGKKLISNLIWQTKYFFLPHLNFITLAKPQYEFNYRPLCLRVSFLQNVFASLVEKIDIAVKNRGVVPGIRNPWDNFIFDIPSTISRRIDALAFAQRRSLLSTNASIIKYTASVLSVLDWLLNDLSSPSYLNENVTIYRSAGGIAPIFPPPVRDDVNALFQQRIKQIEQRHKNPES
ncbi:MAG: hypothetical protein LBS97_05080 [Treponema sp.]|jgi:hypothetical protein|nr:hypothetical protein [Treponema sp.]